MDAAWDLTVDPTDTARMTLATRAPRSAAAGQVHVRVEQIGLSANNVTYAHLGGPAGYWSAFPAGPGRATVPCWGFGTVVDSRCAGVAAGERLFGFLPMSTDVVLTPAVTPDGLDDVAPHRSELHPFYRRYRRVGPPDRLDGLSTLVRPVFSAAFALAEQVVDDLGDRGGRVVLTSASSRTATALAAQLQDLPRLQVTGLTSPRNTRFVEGTGAFAQVLGHDEVGRVPLDLPTVLVDLTRDAALLRALYDHLQPGLSAAWLVGGTHSGSPLDSGELSDPVPRRFFGPALEVTRRAAGDAAGYDDRLHRAEDRFTERAAGWTRVERRTGPDAIVRRWHELLAGRTDPAAATVHTPGDTSPDMTIR